MSYISRSVCLKWLLFILACVGSAWATSGEPPARAGAWGQVHTDFCLDTSGRMGPAEAERCPFQAHNRLGDPPTGSEPARWIRVRVEPASDWGQGLAVHVGPHFLTDVRWYRKVGPDWRESRAGSRQALRDAQSVLGGYRFVDPDAAGEPVTYLVRVPLQGVTHVRVNVEPLAAASSSQMQLHLAVGAQLGALLLMLGFSAVGAWVQPGPLYPRLVLYVALLALGLAAGSGMLAPWGLAEGAIAGHSLFLSVLCLRFVAWVWLSQAFLLDVRTPCWYHPLCKALLATGLACLALVFLDEAALLHGVVVACTVLFSLAQLMVIRQTQDLPKAYRRALWWGHLATPVLLGLAIVASLYPLAHEDLATHLVRLLDFVTPLVFLAMVSYKHRLERQALAQAQAQLAEADLRLDLGRQALQERKLLIDMLTHELKTPLASVSMAMGSLQQHLDGQEPGGAQRRLYNVMRSVQSMNAVIERCALMNRVDDQALAVRPAPVDLAGLVREVSTTRHLEDRVQCQIGEPAWVLGDRQLLQIVVDNLLDNAAKYARPGTPIEVEIRPAQPGPGACVSLAVSNQVEPACMPDPARLGTKFYRHELQHQTSGSGLGLYLIRQICDRLGAQLQHRLSHDRITFEVLCPHEPR